MDYKEKYEQALERARDNYNAADSADINVNSFKNTLIALFPELAESEDERTRNEIIAFVVQSIHRGGGTPIPEKQENKWIAWLEKQNHDGKKWIYEDVYLKEKEQLIQDGIDEVLENPQKYGLEKQGEDNDKEFGAFVNELSKQFPEVSFAFWPA